jgi:uncharacterized protein
MKFLVLLAVLAVAYLVWRNGRIARKDQPPEAPRAGAAPQDMVQCRACGVHLPRGEALPGPDGSLYCCAEHRGPAG